MGDDSAAAFSGGHGACEVTHIGTTTLGLMENLVDFTSQM